MCCLKGCHVKGVKWDLVKHTGEGEDTDTGCTGQMYVETVTLGNNVL